MRVHVLCFLVLWSVVGGMAQQSDDLVIRDIFNNVLENREAYENLDYLTKETPGRLLGSAESFLAVDYMKRYFERLGADSVFLQAFKTPAWKHHYTKISILSEKEAIKLHADALGPSPSTPPGGLTANIVEVYGIDMLETMPAQEIEGKIVFFNKPVDRTLVSTFRVYGSAIKQRYYGPSLAAEKGAVAVLVRSVTTAIDTLPHTGSTGFKDKRIPCAAISTMDADLLSKTLKENNQLKVKMEIEAEDLEEITTYNLVADIRGNEFQDEYIVVGGHIDAWFNSPGAQDDGIGCVQSADVLRIFKVLGIKNKRSIRAILFMDEELFQSGGNAYANYSEKNNIKNFLALEADAGGYTPEGFTVDASDSVFQVISSFKPLLESYGIHYIKKGGSGVDIGPLKDLGVPLMGYRTDSQRYMDVHHSAADTFEKVSIRELQLGSGCMAALVYLVDKYGLKRMD